MLPVTRQSMGAAAAAPAVCVCKYGIKAGWGARGIFQMLISFFSSTHTDKREKSGGCFFFFFFFFSNAPDLFYGGKRKRWEQIYHRSQSPNPIQSTLFPLLPSSSPPFPPTKIYTLFIYRYIALSVRCALRHYTRGRSFSNL